MTGGAVLVVEDSGLQRRLLAGACEQLGHRVGTAGDGAQGLAALRAEAYDVVLLDLLMPVMDGFATLRAIRADPALAHVPVIVISAVDEEDSVVRCIEMGAVDHVVKPFRLPLLRARLDAALAAKRARDVELRYLARVEQLTEAAQRVEAGDLAAVALQEAGRADDALGALARVFHDLVRAAAAREAGLQAMVEELRIEVDAARQDREHARITGADYYRSLRADAARLKRLLRDDPP